MEHLLFATYLIIFAWLITQIKFFKNSGLTAPQLIIVYLLKVIAGIFYGWIGVYYGQMAQMIDTWAFHYESIKSYDLLLHSPSEFFSSLLQNNYGNYGNFLKSDNSWWNDLHSNFFILILSFFNLFSGGNYYINVLIFSFISLFGAMAIYRLMIDVFPKKQTAVFLSIFLFPSFMYWTSGIHKDGIVFDSFALIFYNLYFGFKAHRLSWKKGLLIILGIALLLVLRNYLLVILLPAVVAWYLSQKLKLKPVFIFSGVYLLFSFFFFTAKYIHPNLDFPYFVAQKQADFSTLSGGSEVPITRLQPNLISFIKNVPEAFALSTLRPYPTDVKHLLSLAAAVEINLLMGCFFLFLFFRKKGSLVPAFILFCIFFAVSALLTIGYTVNFLGAVVRYRSIILPFLITPMMAMIDWSKIVHFISNKH